MSGDYKFDTLSLHAGHVPDERHGSRAVPIHQTTSYVFKDTEHAAALYNMELGGQMYIRVFQIRLLPFSNSALPRLRAVLQQQRPPLAWRRLLLPS